MVLQPQTPDNPNVHSAHEAFQREIPWWGDLTAEARAELALNDCDREMSFAQSVDVVVIGGGIAGLSAALAARRAGAQVVLLERNATLGYGLTGRNAGILSAGINMRLAHLPPHGSEAAFWPETTRLLLALIAEAASPDSLLVARQTGAFSLAENASAARNLAREARARVDLGLRAEIWNAEQVAEATAGRLDTRKVASALWLPDEGYVQPLTLLVHLARQARAAGVVLLGHTSVANYAERRGAARGWHVTLDDGTAIEAHGLISAVGPGEQPNARIYALAFVADLPDNFPLFWDASPYTYADYRPGNGRLTVSGGRYGKAGVTRRDHTYYQRLSAGARRWLPELVDREPAYTWAVDLAVTAGTVPELRVLGAIAPGFAIEGLGALGVLPGSILGQRAGKLVAQKVAGASA